MGRGEAAELLYGELSTHSASRRGPAVREAQADRRFPGDVAAARSNHFRITDRAALEAALAPLDGAVEIEDSHDGRICLLCAAGEAWPTEYWDPARQEHREVWVPDLVAPHLADGEVAIFVEVNADKLRAVGGFAEAINNRGEKRVLELADGIYELGRELGPEVTRPEL